MGIEGGRFDTILSILLMKAIQKDSSGVSFNMLHCFESLVAVITRKREPFRYRFVFSVCLCDKAKATCMKYCSSR